MNVDTATKRAFSDPKRRRAWVKYRLDCLGLSMAEVARDAGVGRQTLYQVFQIPYPRMERVVAKAVGLTAQELFPERYRPDGSRILKKRGPKPKKATSKHSKNKRRRNVDGGRDSEHQEAA